MNFEKYLNNEKYKKIEDELIDYAIRWSNGRKPINLDDIPYRLVNATPDEKYAVAKKIVKDGKATLDGNMFQYKRLKWNLL